MGAATYPASRMVVSSSNIDNHSRCLIPLRPSFRPSTLPSRDLAGGSARRRPCRRHFGLVLEMDAWQALAERLQAAGTRFVIEPHIRFEGQPGEQATMFLLDPCGNALEFKAFADRAMLFAK